MLGLWIKEYRVPDFSIRIVLSQITESFRRGTILCIRKFWISKIFMPKRGISRHSLEKLLSHSTEKLRRGTLLFFLKILVTKNFWIRGEEEREGVTFFCSFFLSHSDKR